MYSQCSECALPSENDSPVPFLCQWCQEKQVLQQSIDRANVLEKENNNLRAELEQSYAIHKSANESYEALLDYHAKLKAELEQAKAEIARLREKLNLPRNPQAWLEAGL